MSDPRARRRERVWAWAPALAYMGLIWVLSSIPTQVSLDSVPFRDKGVHFVEYFVLAALLGRALHLSRGDWSVMRVALVAFGVSAGWGYLDELHQAFVPGRDSNVMDVLADAVGSAVGAAAYSVRQRLVQRAARVSDR